MKTANLIMCIVWLIVLCFFVFSCQRKNTTVKLFMPTEAEQDSLDRLVEMREPYTFYHYESTDRDYTYCLVREEWYDDLMSK
jgi:hypothetical protein